MHPVERAYYRKLLYKSRNFEVRMDKKHWCDLQHEHFDMRGKGDGGRVARTRHLNALLRALRRARIELSQQSQLFQLFAYIDIKDSGNDALYVHTPNPNGTPFPSPIEEVSTPSGGPPVLAARVDLRHYEVRRYNEPNSTVFYVIPRKGGLPFARADLHRQAAWPANRPVSSFVSRAKRQPGGVRSAQTLGITQHTLSAAMLSPEVHESVSRSVLCWLATVDVSGQPNVSPKEVFAAFDSEHLVIANIASPTSVRNVEQNPLVCVSFVDVFVQQGYKVLGEARNIRRHDPEFLRWVAPLEAMAGTRFPIHSVLVVRATAIEPILAPSYRLYPEETTEQSQVASALRTYGVHAASGDA